MKDARPDELLRAIKAAAVGQVQLAPEAAARLMREVRAPPSAPELSARDADEISSLR